jgi:hypothetical protein
MPRFLFQTVLALSLPAAAFSQAAQPICSGVGNFSAQSTAINRTGVGTAYSLTATINTETKLSDGNTISGFTTVHQARDTQGRTRVETPSICAMDKDHQPHWDGFITVEDPVASTYTLWQESFPSFRKIATVTHAPSLKLSNPPTAQQEYNIAEQLGQASGHVGPQAKYAAQFKVEDLGKRIIAGLESSGMRITRTVPSGMLGNSLPLTYIEEKWVSDDYRIILLDISDDPVLGKSTYEVTSFTPSEPDPSLFQPPADYEINNRTVTN